MDIGENSLFLCLIRTIFSSYLKVFKTKHLLWLRKAGGPTKNRPCLDEIQVIVLRNGQKRSVLTSPPAPSPQKGEGRSSAKGLIFSSNNEGYFWYSSFRPTSRPVFSTLKPVRQESIIISEFFN